MPENNPFLENRGAILMAASELYHSRKEDRPPDASISQVLPIIKSIRNEDIQSARQIEAKVNVAAKALCRLALIQDEVESGGIRSAVAKTEIALTKVVDYFYIRDLYSEDMMNSIRGISPTDIQEG